MPRVDTLADDLCCKSMLELGVSCIVCGMLNNLTYTFLPVREVKLWIYNVLMLPSCVFVCFLLQSALLTHHQVTYEHTKNMKVFENNVCQSRTIWMLYIPSLIQTNMRFSKTMCEDYLYVLFEWICCANMYNLCACMVWGTVLHQTRIVCLINWYWCCKKT